MLQADAAEILGLASLTVIKGGGGEAERHSGKDVIGFGLRNKRAWQGMYPALRASQRRLSEATAASDLTALWNGVETDPAATDIVVGNRGSQRSIRWEHRILKRLPAHSGMNGHQTLAA